MSNNSDTPVRKRRSTLPQTPEFAQFMSTGWEHVDEGVALLQPGAAHAAVRRNALSAKYVGRTIIIPAGNLVQRSNDTDYPYRAHSAFAHLTGWGSDTVPGTVLVFEPVAGGHDCTLYVLAAPGRDDPAFFTDAVTGEFWTGSRPSLDFVSGELGVTIRDIELLAAVLASAPPETVIVTEGDPELAATLIRDAPAAMAADAELARDVAEMRLVKDEYEIEQMQRAIDATARGFDEIIADLPRSSAHERGERLVEGVFHQRARVDGNDVGYATIAAAGPHATVLHWEKNDGPVRPGDLLLVDAGVEVDSYYTADITRTIPVDGKFDPVQRQIYDAVLDAADAAFAVAAPGVRFRDVHDAAMEVIARRISEWGFLPMSVADALEPDNQPHRRYMVHGTSHHLGLDVHDCAAARLELYQEGILEAGMIFTIEPGLYFQSTDLTVPPEFRGIGVRIEDDILVTADGAVNMSAAIPRTADDVEAWVARLNKLQR